MKCNFTTHGLSHHRIYSVWKNIKARCYNPKSQRYPHYGGRGIILCERWHSVKNFIEDMYPSFEEGLSIDRIDVDGNYEPDNCRWVTKEVQARNKQKIQKNNTSGFRGISFCNRAKKYLAGIRINTKDHFIGYFKNPEQGALAYDTYVRENNLEHTKNFLDEEYYIVKNKYKDDINANKI